ncbi:MAG TPA: hypothetical protein EYH38_03955 [Leucothrix sp.]|nr:hypothetical protein [Leucothrix sp.]
MNETSDNTILYVVINNEPILEFDRKKPLPSHQRQYLDDMDAQMDQGIKVGGDKIENPDPLVRSQFVANSLVSSLAKDEFSTAMAMCAYLAKRMPDLLQIQCKGDLDNSDPESEGLSLEFIFDRNYQQGQQEQTIQFHKTDDNVH